MLWAGDCLAGVVVGILVVRKNGSVIEMPNGAAHFHAELKDKGVTHVVDRTTGRTYRVQSHEDGVHLTEHPHESSFASPLIIRSPKLPMNK